MVSHAISFQEVPDEISLVLNISNCGLSCDGCHSPELQKDIGTVLTTEFLDSLIEKHSQYITCLCFMGGYRPNDFKGLYDLIYHLRSKKTNLKLALYTGYNLDFDLMSTLMLDYIKAGPYIKNLGGLNSKETNQRMFYRTRSGLQNITNKFNEGNI